MARSASWCPLVVVLGACIAAPPPAPALTPRLAAEPGPVAPEIDRLDELLLDRGGCERPCGSDLTLVDADGEVWSWGRAEAEEGGVRTGWVSRERVGLVAAGLVAGDYTSLRSSYDSRRTHARTMMTAAVIDGLRTTVIDRGEDAPASAQWLAASLDDLRRGARWDPGTIAPGPDAARAPACVAVRERVAGVCLEHAHGMQDGDRCRLYLAPAYAALAGALPPELCEVLVASFDRAPGERRPARVRGPRCSHFLETVAHGCVADLRGAPIADPDTTCYALLDATPALSVDREGEEAWLRESAERSDEFWCERWSRSFADARSQP